MDDANKYDTPLAQRAAADFDRARFKNSINDMVSAISRRPNWLMAFDEVQRAIPIKGQSYKGVQTVPVTSIVGSVDRYRDFDRAFLPTHTRTRSRWESVDRATLSDVVLPPIQLYQVGEVYFVKDGNHRVSVAREKDAAFIDAEVIELTTNVPLTPDTDARDLLKMGEYARFLEATKLDTLRPNVHIDFTTLGRYDELLEHISAHRWYMGIEQDRPIEWQEAVLDWYDNIYTPLADIIGRTGILSDFPGHTVGDLYLWIMDHRWYLREEKGEEIGMETAALRYTETYGSWTRKVLRYLRKLRQAATRPLVITAHGIARALGAGTRTTGPLDETLLSDPIQSEQPRQGAPTEPLEPLEKV
ncbi:MAG: transcriptional regulator [Chloroflexia bacterium]